MGYLRENEQKNCGSNGKLKMANNPESAKIMESAAKAFLDHASTAPNMPMHWEINKKTCMTARKQAVLMSIKGKKQAEVNQRGA